MDIMSYLNMEHANRYLNWISDNFDLSMFFLAVVFSLLNSLINRKLTESEIVYRWMAFFVVGFTCVYTFWMHAFYPHYAMLKSGAYSAPYEFQIAVGSLAIAIIGILSFSASFGFRAATTIAATIWMWGMAGGQIDQMLIHHNYAAANTGSWFWMNVVVPFILLICILRMKEGK